MDDGVIVEPLVGARPWRSAAGLEQAMVRVWGNLAVNPQKKEEDGAFEPEQIVWGLQMNFDTLEVRLPEQKCVKAKFLLATPQLQKGCR